MLEDPLESIHRKGPRKYNQNIVIQLIKSYPISDTTPRQKDAL